jgi:hypothetical protein
LQSIQRAEENHNLQNIKLVIVLQNLIMSSFMRPDSVGIEDEAAKDLAICLKNYSVIDSLLMAMQNITDEGMDELGKAMEKNKSYDSPNVVCN